MLNVQMHNLSYFAELHIFYLKTWQNSRILAGFFKTKIASKKFQILIKI